MTDKGALRATTSSSQRPLSMRYLSRMGHYLSAVSFPAAPQLSVGTSWIHT